MSKSSILKVCGMREADNIRDVEALGIDWMGFICWAGSKRYVGNEPPSYLPTGAKRVGVFVNPTLEEVTFHVRNLGLDLIQLHGAESPAFCQEVKLATLLPVIKAFSVSEPADIEAANAYHDIDYFLFDTRTPSVGGSGRQFDWHLLDNYQGSIPFLLSGGIGPDDALRLRAFNHPLCIGFDLNSRFEIAPGLKDVSLLSRFICSLKSSSSQSTNDSYLT